MEFKRAYVEITNICNRQCSFCPGTKRSPGQMTTEQFRLIAGKLRPYTAYLYLHVMGEPLTHPALDALLSIADALAFRVVLTTNGTLLAQKGELLCKARALMKLNISLHSFEANEARNLGGYLRACAEFAAAAADAGKLCNLRLWNLDGELSRGENRLNPILLRELEQVFPRPWTANTRGFRLRERVFLEWGERFDWPSVNPVAREDGVFCYALRQQLAVLCDGTVVPCCLDSEGTLALGNLLTQEPEEILNAEKTRALRESLAHGCCKEPLCLHCGFARRFTRG